MGNRQAPIANCRRRLALLLVVRHTNDRSRHPFLVWPAAFQTSSSRAGQSRTAARKFGMVVVGGHVDAGGLWIQHRLRPPLPHLRNAFVGHVILFVARMSFVLATSVFGFVFIVRRPEFQIPTSRYFILIIGLFALFCYTQELEQLGRALIGPDPGKKTNESGTS
jgi:hypothetical protein